MDCIYKNAFINGSLTDIKVSDGKISALGKFDEDGFDLEGLSVYPGLVDIHSHGCIGYDTMDGNHLEEMSHYQAQNGVTSWLPTTMTVSVEDIKKTVNVALPKNCGANILGFHLEGPYISKKYKGAQNEKYIKAPSIEEFSEFKNAKIVTIAPELESSMEFIEKCGCVLAIGHTDADYEKCIEAFDKGANCLTHTFNAMPPLHHRNPGPIGAAIDKNAYVQVICDGLHIHKSVIQMLYRTFGTDRMILISDSMRATGVEDGEYEFGGQTITVKNGIARTADGALAGSTTNLLGIVKKAVEFGISADDAFKMASQTPSELIGVKKGRIEVGYDAEFIAVDDNLNVRHCIINGEVYKA